MLPVRVLNGSVVKLEREEQEIEALVGTAALTLQKPDAALLKRLSESAEATLRKLSDIGPSCVRAHLRSS